MDSLTLFGHLFKTRCEAICIFLDFFTEKRGSQREIYDFFRKSHETHCICKRFSIYCNKNCSGNMRILCHFAEITYTPPGDENSHPESNRKHRWETTYTPLGDENSLIENSTSTKPETTHTPSGDENSVIQLPFFAFARETTYTPLGDENMAEIVQRKFLV